MENKIDNSPVTVHGDGSTTGTNVNNIIPTKGKNKFLDKYNDTKKTETEQLLQGLPEFVIKDLVLYLLYFKKYFITLNLICKCFLKDFIKKL